MNIWQTIELNYGGESYSIKPTLELINAIESQPGCSLTQINIRLHNRDLPSSTACYFIATVLRAAGANVTAEQVYADTAGIGADVVGLVIQILAALMPEPKGVSTPKPQPQARPRKSTGAKSTG